MEVAEHPRVESAISGAPERPPASPRWSDARVSGRDSVVLLTITPSKPAPATASAMASISAVSRSGAAPSGTPDSVAGQGGACVSADAAQQLGQRVAGLQGAQAGRVFGEETLTVK